MNNPIEIAVQRLLQAGRAGIDNRVLALSGGSKPKVIYKVPGLRKFYE